MYVLSIIQSKLILSSQAMKFNLRICLKLFITGQFKYDIKSNEPTIT